ncbi:MAG: type IV secretion system protein [Burkholderiales bacterium]|nr:type IV secretion system protein [Burkholderiales bacterium]MBP9769030.1 type IV secretion system protein [Burkholderiales bacterium]
MKKTFYLLMLFFLYSSSAYAAACALTPGGTYDTMVNSFATAAASWNAKLLPLVTRIFWGIFAAEFLYQLTFKKILSNDLSKLYVFFVIRMFTAYVFAYIFLDLSFYTGIIKFFTRFGIELGNPSSVITDSGPLGLGLSPSGVMSYLSCEFSGILAALYALMLIPTAGDFFCIAAIILILLMNLMAVLVAVMMLDAYIVIFGGFILVGFSGSSWTQSYWQKYLSYAVGTGIRLFVTCLILGLIISGFNFINTPSGLDLINPIAWANYLFSLLGMIILSVYLLFTVPSKAASMLTGSMGGGMGELVGAASMLMAGGSMAKLAGGGAKGGAKALMEKLGGPGKNPSPSTLKSNTTTATQSAKSETAKSGKVEAMGKSMGQGEQPTPKPKFNDSLPDSGSTPAPSSSAGSPSSSSSGSTQAPTGSGGNSGSIGGGKGSTTPQSSTKATLAKHGKSFADSVNKVSSGHAGAADININPHKE